MFALCRPKHQGSTPRGTPGNFAHSDPPPVDLSVGDIRSQIAAEWLQIACNGHNGEPIGNHHRSFVWCNRWPLRPPLPPKIGVSYAPNIREWPYLCNGWSNPLHVWGRVGFSGTADRTVPFTIRTNPRWRPPPSWKNFKWPYLRNRSSDPLHVWLLGGFSGTADLMALFSIRTNSRLRPPPSCIIVNGHISTTAHDLHI